VSVTVTFKLCHWLADEADSDSDSTNDLNDSADRAEDTDAATEDNAGKLEMADEHHDQTLDGTVDTAAVNADADTVVDDDAAAVVFADVDADNDVSDEDAINEAEFEAETVSVDAAVDDETAPAADAESNIADAGFFDALPISRSIERNGSIFEPEPKDEHEHEQGQHHDHNETLRIVGLHVLQLTLGV
jgi:hypothetical protein